MDSLQYILALGLVIMVAINASYLMWAIRLKNELRRRPSPKVYEVKVDAAQVMADVDMHKVEKIAKQQITHAVNATGVRFQGSLDNTVDQLSAHISDMVTNSLSGEFEKYQVSLQALRDQSIQEYTKLQQELDDRRTRLTEHLDHIIQSVGEERLSALDTRMNDVISSYLIESLGTQVDLGAQSAYIFETLEKHRDEIKRDILA